MPQRIIDLTHLMNDRMMVYPDTPPPSFKVTNVVEKDGYREHHISMMSHTGTHVDAPRHVIRNGKSLDQFPIDKFIGRAVVIPCHNQREITVEFLRPFEHRITAVDFVLFFTGWQERWNTDAYAENCPVPTVEAARYLARFNLKGVGIDAFSLDRIGSATVVSEDAIPIHHILLGAEILIIENLTSVDQLPEWEFTFQCFPLKVEDADGSPIRAIAVVED